MWATNLLPTPFSHEYLSLFVILDRQLGAIWQPVIVATVESQIIGCHVVVVVQLESQADLRDTGCIDVFIGRRIQPGIIPTVQGVVLDHADCIPAGWALEI